MFWNLLLNKGWFLFFTLLLFRHSGGDMVIECVLIGYRGPLELGNNDLALVVVFQGHRIDTRQDASAAVPLSDPARGGCNY